MNIHKLALVASLTFACLSGTPAVQAFDGFAGLQGGQPFPWFGYGNSGPAAYSLGNIPAPPYFALHPPVYYSHLVPRSYGQSPFAGFSASPEQRTMAVRVLATSPAPPAARSEPTDKPVKVAVTSARIVAPRRIVNPYYQPAGREATLASERK